MVDVAAVFEINFETNSHFKNAVHSSNVRCSSQRAPFVTTVFTNLKHYRLDLTVATVRQSFAHTYSPYLYCGRWADGDKNSLWPPQRWRLQQSAPPTMAGHEQYAPGDYVPSHFDPSIVAASYFASLCGCLLTIELLHRRGTALNNFRSWSVLDPAMWTMGAADRER